MATPCAPRCVSRHRLLPLLGFLLLLPPAAARADWALNGDPLQTGLEYIPGSHRVVSDGSGGVIAVWEVASAIPGATARGQKISRYGQRSWVVSGMDLGVPLKQLDAVSDGAGGVIVVGMVEFGDIRATDIYAQRYDGAGQPLWGASGVIVCSADDYQTEPRVISDGAGGALIFWYDEQQSNVYGQRLTASGTPLWTPNGNLVGGPGVFIAYFSVVSDGQGGAVVLGDPQGSEVFLQRIGPAGNRLWPPSGVPFALANSSSAVLEPSGDGGAIVGWAAQGPVLMIQRFDAGGVPLWPGGGVRVSTVTGLGSYFDLEGDGAGGVWAAWTDSRMGTSRSIFAQHLDGSGARLLGDAAVEVDTDTNLRILPTLCLDGQGGSIITWTDYRSSAIPGQSSDVYAQRLDATGTKLWAPQGVAIAALEGFQALSTLYPDGLGGAFVLWSDTRVGHQNALLQGDLYLTRVSGGGAVAAVPTPILESGGFPVQLAPNPTRGRVWLMSGRAATGPAALTLFDAAGRRVFHQTVELEGGVGARWPIDLVCPQGMSLRAGAYFYRLETGVATGTGKLVVRP